MPEQSIPQDVAQTSRGCRNSWPSTSMTARVAEAEIPTTSLSNRGGLRGRGVRGLHGGGIKRFRSGDACGHLEGSSTSDGGRKKKNARRGEMFSGLSIPLAATFTTARSFGT